MGASQRHDECVGASQRHDEWSELPFDETEHPLMARTQSHPNSMGALAQPAELRSLKG